MDKLWLKENLDLKMVTFSCVPTGERQGMLEMITEAKTLREIQVGFCCKVKVEFTVNIGYCVV